MRRVYIVGWHFNDTTAAWELRTDFSPFGAYAEDSEDFDTLVRDKGLSVIVTAGNDRNDGPTGTEDADQGTGNGGYDTIATDGPRRT